MAAFAPRSWLPGPSSLWAEPRRSGWKVAGGALGLIPLLSVKKLRLREGRR